MDTVLFARVAVRLQLTHCLVLQFQEFDAAFREIDTDGSGEIEFEEFASFYRSQDDQQRKKILALKAEAELLRRLESGMLTSAQEQLVRERLNLPAVPV
eukprot:COSAG02_NODE_18912_length_911_cov_0.657635_2_plen_99_part_00